MSATTVFLALVAVVVTVVGIAAAAAVRVIRRHLAAAEARSAADRDAAVHAVAAAAADSASGAAVDRSLALAGERLGTEVAAGHRALDQRSQEFDRRAVAVEARLGEMTAAVEARLADVGRSVEALRRERAEQHGTLDARLEEATAAQRSLASTTQSLREALANPKARGNWGERTADDVLRLSGLTAGASYVKQMTLPNGTRPDFSFPLPNGLFLHMDVKFPVDNYLESLEADARGDETGRTAAEKTFRRDVRSHLKALGERGYADEATTVGYVLVFIPNEAVYGFIHEHDPTLIDDALTRRVVLCCPSTLFAVLAVVRQAADLFVLEQRSDEILERLAGFRGQWTKVSDAIDKVGRALSTADRAYDELTGVRTRTLDRELDQIERLTAERTDRGDRPSLRSLPEDDGATRTRAG